MDYFILQLSLSLREAKARTPGRNLETGTKVENINEQFLIQPRTTYPWMMPPTVGWASHTKH